MELVKGIKPPKGLFVVVAAVEGWGKSTLGASMPGAAFIDTDKGIVSDDIIRIDSSYGCMEMLGIVEEFKKSPPTGVKTIVIDTMDKLIDSMTEDMCRMEKWATMEEKQYFKCWVEFRTKYYLPLINGLKDVTRKHPITVLVLSHVKARKFEKPNGEGAWDKWETTFQYKELCADLKQAADLYVFGDFKDVVFEADKKSGETKRHANGSGKRMAYCEHNGAFDAKCRSFVKKADGTPFPKSCTVDDFRRFLGEAIDGLQKDVRSSAVAEAKSAPVRKEPTPEQAEAGLEKIREVIPEAERVVNPSYEKLVQLVKQFGIDMDLINKYVCTTKTFGPNPPPLQDCNAKALDWLCSGITQKVINNEFIINKLNALKGN